MSKQKPTPPPSTPPLTADAQQRVTNPSPNETLPLAPPAETLSTHNDSREQQLNHLLKALNLDNGWSPEFTAFTLVERHHGIAAALESSGRGDIDQTRAVKQLLEDVRTDGPVFNSGRREGQDDVLVQVRSAVDPEDTEHMTGEAAMARVTTVMDGLRAVAHDGEHQDTTLGRILRERDDALAQAQATHSVLGPHANARGILMTHVAESGPDYDTGGRYRVATITVSGGVVDIREIYDLGPNGEPSPVMQYGTAVDHVEKRVDDFLRPKAHRS